MRHHYYGHVQDVTDINFGFYMFGIPFLVVIFIISLVTGLWPLLLLWFLIPEGDNDSNDSNDVIGE